jgi:type III secretion protein Q
MTSSLPFDTPVISRGFASLTPSARQAGRHAAESASRALTELLQLEVVVEGRPVPMPAAPAIGTAAVTFGLEALPGAASLEIDVRLLARTVERLAGFPPATPAALAATEVEQSVLELIALAAADAARSPAVDALVPRLIAASVTASDALAVDLELTVGGDRGRGRLLVPSAAVAALGACPELPDRVAALDIPGLLYDGAVSLAEGDLSALSTGDVLLLDEGSRQAQLVLPGGLALWGRIEGDHLQIEEIRMTEAQSSYPITLAVEIARVSLTLGELARLEPGAAVPLAISKQGTVVLRAGDRAIARGQLVDVDGAMGVQLIQIGELP